MVNAYCEISICDDLVIAPGDRVLNAPALRWLHLSFGRSAILPVCFIERISLSGSPEKDRHALWLSFSARTPCLYVD
jgi:hypothetical protein